MKRPGGELATRPVHFIWICDCSGSMSLDGKIESLNQAVSEALPHMRKVADENPNAQVLVRTARFSHGAKWMQPEAIPLERFAWQELAADPLQRPTADIVFMVDTSGSMSDEIEAVKGSCVAFADRIARAGASVRLGLIGFDIGGHYGGRSESYSVHNLSRYTIGVWPLTAPEDFRRQVQELSLGLFGGAGCYLANRDTVDIFPHVVRTFSGPADHRRILVIISDEMGDTGGLQAIVSQLRENAITAYVLGVPGERGAHESIARSTGGKYWNITSTMGVHDFSDLLETVATTVAHELTQQLADGSVSSGTDMGAALRLVAGQLKMPPMSERGLPPVLVLISDGQPTDDFEAGLRTLMREPWATKAVRIAVAIGGDADPRPLQRFIGNAELKPLQANNPEVLVRQIRWASTIPLQAASAPPSQASSGIAPSTNVPLSAPRDEGTTGGPDVW